MTKGNHYKHLTQSHVFGVVLLYAISATEFENTKRIQPNVPSDTLQEAIQTHLSRAVPSTALLVLVCELHYFRRIRLTINPAPHVSPRPFSRAYVRP